MGKSTISMVIFNSYVSLPEGIMVIGWSLLLNQKKPLLLIETFFFVTNKFCTFQGDTVIHRELPLQFCMGH